MKKLIIFISVLCFANDTKEILDLLNILKHQHSVYKPIQNLYNPFKTKQLKTDKKATFIIKKEKPKPKYILEVVFQNKARIDGKWYKNNDNLDKYKVIIRNNKVFLQSNSKIIYLKRKTILKVTK